MTERARPERARVVVTTRRSLLLSGLAAVAFSRAWPVLADAAVAAPERTEKFKDAFDKLIGAAKPVEGKISVDLPETAENGNFVPVSILIDSPMTETDHVKTIHLMSTGNPWPNVATFHLSPLNGLAKVSSRMRLARTQDVIVVAELSDGNLAIATTLVKVTIGGCAN